jgi:hypothetical protein
MRIAIFLAILLLFQPVASARSETVLLSSPDHAQTFAYGEMIWHQLFVPPAGNNLVARITFSNVSYVGGYEPRIDESFDFRFPNTHLDRANRTLFVRNRHGQQMTIARFRGDPTNGWVDLTAEAKIYLLKESGRVTALLTATADPRPGMRWIQMDDNWSLQNLLVKLCCR